MGTMGREAPGTSSRTDGTHGHHSHRHHHGHHGAHPKHVRKFGFDHIETRDFIPRPYQIELYEAAKTTNLVICLGTGTGKTFIAAMLLKENAHQVRDIVTENGRVVFNPEDDSPVKRSVFLVPTVQLVKQQASVIREFTELKVGEFIGAMGVDTWAKETWHTQFKEYQVLVMTAEIFRVIIHHAFIPFRKLNLLVFDEAHHATKNHPYAEILKCLDNVPEEEHPRILGLSASLINSHTNPSNLHLEIKALERLFHGKCETASDLRTINKYGARPEESIWYYSNIKELPFVTTEIEDCLQHLEELRCEIKNLGDNDKLEMIRTIQFHSWTSSYGNHFDIKKILSDIVYVYHNMGIWCVKEAANEYIRELAERVVTYNFDRPLYACIISSALTVLNALKIQSEKVLARYSEKHQIIDLSPPKMRLLLKTIKSYSPSPRLAEEQPDNPFHGLCGIIFAERRIVAKTLCHWLQKVSTVDSQNYGTLSCDFIFGHGALSGPSASVTSMPNKRQEEALRRFRSHECNLIVATSVLEEGLDVPKCNMVIRYDLPRNFREYIQSKGRARADGGRFILLVEEDENSLIEARLEKYVHVEDILAKCCHGRPSFEDDPSKDNVQKGEEDIPPYIPHKKDGPRATLSSAIGIINRYCLKLPSDSFTKLAPDCKVFRCEDGKFQAVLRLPINSPLRDPIRGERMSSAKLAKKAAALAAVKELHKEGELDNNLLPVGKEALKCIEELRLDVHDEDAERVPRGAPRPGTTKRRQYYNKRLADVLQGQPPKAATECYLYEFEMKLTCPIPEEQNTRGRKITDPADTPRNFGVLSTQKLPPICSFPVFTRSGETKVSMKRVARHHKIVLDEEQVKKAAYFHQFLFSQVLRLEKYPMRYDPSKAKTSFYVVPVNTCGDNATKMPIIKTVDWDFVDLIFKQKDNPITPISEKDRKNFKFQREKYLDAVVLPWYRQADKPQFFFYVAEICEDLTPKSDFPHHIYENFQQYYQEKYKIRIMNLEQPLLDVDHTSARLNLLTPRYVNRKGMTLPTSTAKTKKDKRENLQQKQILVPELCVIHPFPASLWRKAVCLPCILYRMNSLMIAEQLRHQVAVEINVGISNPTEEDFEWPPLDFGWSLMETVNPSESKVDRDDGDDDKDDISDDGEDDGEVSQKDLDSSSGPAASAPPPKRSPSSPPKPKPTTSSSNHRNFKSSSRREESYPDFPIDHFDPEKHKAEGPCSDDNPWIKANELNHLISDPFASPDSAIDDNLSNDGFRVGSPSNFESKIRGPDPWETCIEAGVKSVEGQLGLPGLKYLSTTGGLNLDTLSQDLQYRHADLYGDMDDLSDDEELMSYYEGDDEEDLDLEYDDEDGPTPKITNYYQPPRAAMNKAVKRSLIEIDNPMPLSPISNSEIQENGDISHLPPYSRSDNGDKLYGRFKKVKCELDAPNYEALAENLTRDSILTKLFKELDAAFEEELRARFSDVEQDQNEESVDQGDGIDKERDTQEEEDPWADDGEGAEEACFGELLPNREAALDGEALESSFAYNFRFDPYVDDEQTKGKGPNPGDVLQALTMSNASDGINLERLETVGDSFLKYAVTAFLYCMCPNIHEGRLSYFRSKQISNYNLYRLGRKRNLGEIMMATKFEPNDNWLPPGYVVPDGLEDGLIAAGGPNASGSYNIAAIKDINKLTEAQLKERASKLGPKACVAQPHESKRNPGGGIDNSDYSIPYNLLTQHSIPDKSIADCVEALIGAYLIRCGPRGALLFMDWLGLRVIRDPSSNKQQDAASDQVSEDLKASKMWRWLPEVRSPLLVPHASYLTEAEKIEERKRVETNMEVLYYGSFMDKFEEQIGYKFQDQAYLVQAFTHNSFSDNHATDCYQRLEFLGDAVLDYLITRVLFEDPQRHSPGTLTDLRSALVNNTFFARLAVKYNYHKYLKILSNDLFRVVKAFVDECSRSEMQAPGSGCNLYLEEGETENAEEIEVPKALGDIFESVAGAIYLDSGMSLDAVWKVYFPMMKPEIDYYSTHVPKSPIRELLEMEPQNAKFGKPELISGRKVCVVVEVFGEGKFIGIGRNKRIAKCTAAKRALRHLKPKKFGRGTSFLSYN